MFSFSPIIKNIFIILLTGALGVFLGLDLKIIEGSEALSVSTHTSVESLLYPVSPTLPKELRSCISGQDDERF